MKHCVRPKIHLVWRAYILGQGRFDCIAKGYALATPLAQTMEHPADLGAANLSAAPAIYYCTCPKCLLRGPEPKVVSKATYYRHNQVDENGAGRRPQYRKRRRKVCIGPHI